MFNEIYNKIKEYDTIIIHRHNKPDGDALGSQIGLKEAILATFPNKVVKITGDMTERYSFMGKMDEISDELYKDALVFVLDSGQTHLISDTRFNCGKFMIKMDHHLAVEDYANINYVDTSRESCAGLIADFIKTVGMNLTKVGAEALFTGMVTDSGRFRFPSVSSKTFDSASFLMKYGVDTEYIYTNLYTENLSNVLLKARMTLKFEILDCGVAYVKNTYQDVLETGMNSYSLARAIVNNMSGIKEIKIWATFTELEDGRVIIELRSSKANINEIAVKYGGGGHIQASGATVESWDIIDNVIEDLIKKASEV